MNQALILSLLLLVGGVYFGVRSIHFMRNERALREYMQSSPKAALWVGKYGLDAATKMARESFIPVSLVLSSAMVGLGAWNLWRLFG